MTDWTNWIKWNGGGCPIKSDKMRVEATCRGGYVGRGLGVGLNWKHENNKYDIIAYRIIEDHEPVMTREQITAQIEALQKQLDALPVVVRYWYDFGAIHDHHHFCATHYFDIETINGVPHIHGVAMKEVDK